MTEAIFFVCRTVALHLPQLFSYLTSTLCLSQLLSKKDSTIQVENRVKMCWPRSGTPYVKYHLEPAPKPKPKKEKEKEKEPARIINVPDYVEFYPASIVLSHKYTNILLRACDTSIVRHFNFSFNLHQHTLPFPIHFKSLSKCRTTSSYMSLARMGIPQQEITPRIHQPRQLLQLIQRFSLQRQRGTACTTATSPTVLVAFQPLLLNTWP